MKPALVAVGSATVAVLSLSSGRAAILVCHMVSTWHDSYTLGELRHVLGYRER